MNNVSYLNKVYFELNMYMERNKYITLTANFGETEVDFQGVIVKLSKSLVCLSVTSDWHFDGFIITQLKFISEILCGDLEDFNLKVLKKENQFNDGYPRLEWLDLEDISTAIHSLQKNHNNIQVECLEPERENFAIGKISAIGLKDFKLKGYTATADIEDGNYIIPYDDVSVIKFLDEYSTILMKYVKE